MTATTTVTVDLDAIEHNVRALRSCLTPGTRVLAVVKADAYGHGTVPVARAALAAGADHLGVAHLETALELRRAGITAPILAWLYTPASGSELREALRYGVEISVGSEAMTDLVLEAAAAEAARPRVHVKIDTGMGRNGILLEDAEEFGAYLARRPLDVVGAWTHLANSDVADLQPHQVSVDLQLERFRTAAAALEAAVGPIPLRHVAATAGALTRPDAHFDMVRLGIGIYGYAPDGSDPRSLGPDGTISLHRALTVSSEVALVRDVPAGTTVSYGSRYTTSGDTRLVLVPIGYADGLPRAAAGALSFTIVPAVEQAEPDRPRGSRPPVTAAQRGTICMDQIILEVPRTADVRPGDRCLIIGPDTTADHWARASGTISYEILTSVSPRLGRTYTGGASL